MPNNDKHVASDAVVSFYEFVIRPYNTGLGQAMTNESEKIGRHFKNQLRLRVYLHYKSQNKNKIIMRKSASSINVTPGLNPGESI